jgi:hypothetical protein
MKYFTVKQLDLSKYKSITSRPLEVSGGTRPRLTLIHKDGRRFFFKTYSHTPREIWAECLASHIAELMNIDAQEVTIKTTSPGLKTAMQRVYPNALPKNWQPIGTVARNIFPKNIEIIYGSAILGSTNIPLTLEDIENKLRSRYYAPDDLLQDFANMIVFDFFIGNMDRHHENWGICEDKKYVQQVMFDRKPLINLRYFTPLFDHGSSLMFELDDGKAREYLDDENKLTQYIENAKFGFFLDTNGNKENPLEIIRQHLTKGTAWKPRLIKSIKNLKKIDQLGLSSLIIQMPSLDILEYGYESRRLLHSSLMIRYNKLSELVR